VPDTEIGSTPPRAGITGKVAPAARTTLRFVLSLVGASALCYAFWRHLPPSLSVRTSIIGYPTFADFDPNKYYDTFYLVAIAFPLLAILLYYVVGLPFAEHRSSSPSVSMFPVPTRRPPPRAESSRHHLGVLTPVWSLIRVSLPALVIAAEVGVERSPHAILITGSGWASGVLYVLAVVALGMLVHRLGVKARHRRTVPPDLVRNLPAAMSAVNAVLALVVIPLLYGVSVSTNVTVGHASHVVRYPWFPLWLVVLASAGLGWWTVAKLRRVINQRGVAEVETGTLTLIVGSVAILLGTAVLPGALGAFSGFDDSQYLAAPQLVFAHGLLPWSQILAFHGLLYDVFSGAFGMVIFGHSRWGVAAGHGLLLIPATWIGLYLMGVHFLRRNLLLSMTLALAIILGFIGTVDNRWLIYPYLFIGLDRVLRKRSASWSVIFTVSVIIQAVVVPETDLITVVLLVTVFLFELATRSRDASWRQNFFRSLWCLVGGISFLLLFSAYLLATRSLGAFFNYYIAVVPGHNLEGAKPIGHVGLLLTFQSPPSLRYTVELLLPVALFLLTAWLAVAKLRRRSPWDSAHWVMVAAALGGIVYYDEALARADTGHVAEMFTAVFPLIILWVREIAVFVDRAMERCGALVGRIGSRSRALSVVGSGTWIGAPAVAVAVLAAIILSAPQPLTALQGIPAQFHASAPTPAPAQLPRLGYTLPGTVDMVQIEDLGRTIDTYAGSGAPVFDFDNEPGILYYLLNRVPGTRFYIVASALTPAAQNLLISDLRKSNPRLVLFTDTTFEFGLPVEDSYKGMYMYDMVQNYAVSQYLLDHYRPLVSIQGQLLMLRDDLFGRVPPPPTLPVPPIITNLYFSMQSCSWGFTPNFLPPPVFSGQQHSIRLTVTHRRTIGETFSGWAVDHATLRPATAVVAVRDSRVIASVQPSIPRPDVVSALHSPVSLMSGFSFAVPPGKRPVTLFALNENNTVTPIYGSSFPMPVTPPSSITLSNGHTEPVITYAGNGYIDGAVSGNQRVLVLQAPSNTDLSRYRWVTVTTNSGEGHQQFVLSDVLGNVSHDITWSSLPQGGARISVQVGSCLQWHGFDRPLLYLGVEGHGTIRSVTLTT
jgi:hypothetical protein